MSDWRTIESAPKDGFIDAYNCHTGERRVTYWDGANDIDMRMGFASPWRGWDPNWGNGPTHWQPLPPPPAMVQERG